jgi:hypothetical protein
MRQILCRALVQDPWRVYRTLSQTGNERSRLRTVMPSKVYSAAVVGMDAFEIEIEVHAGWGRREGSA